MNVASADAIVERYETLRAAVLGRRVGAERQSMALLLREGMSSWSSAWAACAPAPTQLAAPAASQLSSEIPHASELVQLLASMALSTLQESPA